MEDLDKNLENNIKDFKEGRKFSLEFKANALQQLILQRFQSLTTLSFISFAVVGLVISIKGELIQRNSLAIISIFLLLLVAFVSFGRYLYIVRSDIKKIAQKIEDLQTNSQGGPIKKNGFKADWWPETLYVLLIVGIVLFTLSLIV